MNNPFVLVIVLIIVLAVAAVLVFLARKRSSSPESSQPVLDIGKVGELHAKEALQSLAGHKRFLSNCYLPKDDGTDTEVDLILLHGSGIYVIESKNYNGSIYGSEGDQNWTQSLAGGRRKTSFYNPIRQNKGHIKWLKKYLDLGSDIPCYSVIVFGDNCKLKKIALTSGEHFVVNCRELLETVQKNAKAVGQILSRQQIDTYYQRLDPLTQASEERKTFHVETVRQKQAAAKPVAVKSAPSAAAKPAAKSAPPITAVKAAKQEERVCPRCGGKLVLRTAGKGEHIGEEFWGCSNFPKCWYKERICPKCGGKLVLRTAGKGEHVGEEFLACSNFPKCRYKEYSKETANVR